MNYVTAIYALKCWDQETDEVSPILLNMTRDVVQ